MVHATDVNGLNGDNVSDGPAAAPLSTDNAKEENKRNALHVIDGRTGLEYDIPIKRNAIEAIAFKNIKAGGSENTATAADNIEGGLRILDPGMQNTAAKESRITYV